jgi:hypothetical protein
VRRLRIAVLATAVTTACVLAMAAVPAAAEAELERALVRVAHFSPDASYVDVYMVSLNRRQLFPNVFYKSVSAYWPVNAGPFTYEVRAAGAAPESEPVIQVKGNLAAGRAYTVAAVGRRDRLQGVLLRDDMSPSAPGKAKVRFLDAALDLPAVDFAVAGGPVVESRVGFREPTGYRQLASGRYRVEVRRSGAEAVVARARSRSGRARSPRSRWSAEPASRVSCTPSAMLPGPGRRRPAASAPGRAGSHPPPAPRPPRCPSWPPRP